MHAKWRNYGMHNTKLTILTMESERKRNWFFTWNNYDEQSIEYFREYFETGKAVYIVIGKEVGESGTPHLQGCIFLKNAISMRGLRKIFGSGLHWEVTRREKASIDYCKKDGDYVEFGEYNNAPGKRNDLEEGCKSLLSHRSITRFKSEHPTLWVKYPRGFSTLLERPTRCPSEFPIVQWVYGPTGVGKTRGVFEESIKEGIDLWISNEDLKWFDGYEGQPWVLFDDFRADFCKFHTLLRYLDRYPVKVPIKGGFENWAPTKIFITSCHHPKDVYQKSEEDVQQLIRRITSIIHIPFKI